jgi:hypothetical protein
MAGRSGCWLMLCVICTVHEETRSTCFLIESQNQGRRFVSGLTSKSLGWFSLLLPQNRWQWFVSGLTSKPLGRFSPVWPQNRWRRFSPIWPQNRWRRFSPKNLYFIRVRYIFLLGWTIRWCAHFFRVCKISNFSSSVLLTNIYSRENGLKNCILSPWGPYSCLARYYGVVHNFFWGFENIEFWLKTQRG